MLSPANPSLFADFAQGGPVDKKKTTVISSCSDKSLIYTDSNEITSNLSSIYH